MDIRYGLINHILMYTDNITIITKVVRNSRKYSPTPIKRACLIYLISRNIANISIKTSGQHKVTIISILIYFYRPVYL